jgi:hypothetical protein
MNKKLCYGLIMLLFGALLFNACENTSTNSVTLEESLDLFTDLAPVEGASNSTFTINRGKDLTRDGYFEINVSNFESNELVKTGRYGAWCIEWKKPIRSSNDEHTGVKLYSTSGQNKWKPLTYFFSIKNDLSKEDPSLTYREYQAVIWSLAGYMGVAPEFDLDKLKNSEIPSRLKQNGQPIVDKDKVRTIVNRVKGEYSDATVNLPGGNDGLIIAETNGDEQDIVLEPVARIELTPSPLSLAVNEQRQMTAKVLDEDGNEITDAELIWSIDDDGIATVSQNGVVQGVSIGQTIVRVESGGKEATAIVTVSAIVDNLGNEFVLGMLPNLTGPGYTTELHLTSNVEANVVIEYPINSPTFTQTVSLTPGSISIITVPLTSSSGWNAGTVDNNAIRASSNQDFVVYAINRRDASTDAALILPASVLGTEHYVSGYTPLFNGVFSVVATTDGTEVEITPTNGMIGGYTANSPFTVTLNRGEGFLGQALNGGPTGDLSGTFISSSDPVAVTNGNLCTNVPVGNTACDHLFEMAHPVYSWTTESIAAPLPNRPFGSIYRVLASEDNTTIERNGSVVATINAGEFYESAVEPGAQRFTANNPIFATQLMTGITQSGTNIGDPAMGNMIPTEQYLMSYTFSTVGGAQFRENWVNVVAHTDDVSAGTILLDGAPIPSGDFTAIADTDFQYVQVQITEGTHATSSASRAHGISVMGFDSADSYIYPGGAGISDL